MILQMGSTMPDGYLLQKMGTQRITMVPSAPGDMLCPLFISY